ncbi:DUF3455 domain-containing protein [Usitatibacter palustris]|uniref:Vanadium-dependent haloperoxidase NapH1-like second helical-bundle domain-containing protein n=1 Tax=Usitatibacter palustris TaxID=2732487 RepID=A0A6M4HBC6_9PROT|nr:DUF3455 domain-containing protein [Usitatibacter palustris]QJR16158.1 hypothetical protein DSM104440_02987 [Usitatibacter palustris]
MHPIYRIIALAVAAAFAPTSAQADAVTDWNLKSSELVTEAKLGTPPAVRTMAIVQTAVYEAVLDVTGPKATSPNASVDAAVAAAQRATLVKLMPAVQASIDAAYAAAIAKVADGPAKTAGIATGEKAAAAVFAARAADTVAAESYRPHTAPGMYVPTAAPAVPTWSQRKPWLLASADQVRPGPPPALGSAEWVRDFNEVKTIGAKASTQRTPQQTDIARFWDYSLPSIYYGVVQSVAAQPGRTVLDNARLYAAVAQSMDDALIAVFDAKYRYNFWRPATAIRNADQDGNDATERDAGWTSLIDAPMHPEYPSGHSILANAVTSVLRAEVGNGPVPTLSATSPTAKGAKREWTRLDDFATEVSMSRVYGGIHYRTALDTGAAMGRQIGEMAARRFPSSATLAAVPESLVPAGEQVVERIAARGVQVYECREQPNNGGMAWAFVAPEAALYDAKGDSAGTHYAGPHWEATDGSKIVGAVKAKADAPVKGAIPWLLLTTRSVGSEGRYAGVTSVQRVNTVGGVAPAKTCDATNKGAVEKVAYTADYVLLAKSNVAAR